MGNFSRMVSSSSVASPQKLCMNELVSGASQSGRHNGGVEQLSAQGAYVLGIPANGTMSYSVVYEVMVPQGGAQ